MATFTGKTPAQTYESILHLADESAGMTASLQAVQSGDGTACPLELSTANVNVSSGFQLNGTDAQSGALLSHEVGGLESDISAIADGDFIVGTGAGTLGLENGATARVSMGVTIGTDVQAYDAGLADIAGLAVTDGNVIVGNGSIWVAESGATARTSLGLGTGDSPTFTAVSTDTINENTADNGVVIDDLTIKDGNLIGKSSDDLALTAADNGMVRIYGSTSNQVCYIRNNGSTTPSICSWKLENASPDNNTQWILQAADSTTQRVIIWSDGDLANHDGVYGTISDKKLKQDLAPSGSQWDDVKALAAKTRKFRMKTDVKADPAAPEKLGWTAQDVEAISPGLVVTSPIDGESTKWIKSSILFTKAVKALGEALERIEELEAKVG